MRQGKPAVRAGGFFLREALGLLFAVNVVGVQVASATIPLETETAVTQPRNGFEGDLAYEYQVSSEGTEMALPLALEYGILDNLELLVEPVLFTAILPDQGVSHRGLGDLEVTLNWRWLGEGMRVPAFALAAEVKVPTARDSLIGTGAADYTAYLVASKAIGPMHAHANIGYTWQGSPKGANLSNLVSFAFALEQLTTGRLQWMVEVLGNSPVGAGSSLPENPVTPEAAGGELAGTVGVRWFFARNLALAFGATFDNSQAFQFAPGLIMTFH